MPGLWPRPRSGCPPAAERRPSSWRAGPSAERRCSWRQRRERPAGYRCGRCPIRSSRWWPERKRWPAGGRTRLGQRQWRRPEQSRGWIIRRGAEPQQVRGRVASADQIGAYLRITRHYCGPADLLQDPGDGVGLSGESLAIAARWRPRPGAEPGKSEGECAGSGHQQNHGQNHSRPVGAARCGGSRAPLAGARTPPASRSGHRRCSPVNRTMRPVSRMSSPHVRLGRRPRLQLGRRPPAALAP